ncbi:MAG: YfiR family protein [Bryobacteraceae bacterium]
MPEKIVRPKLALFALVAALTQTSAADVPAEEYRVKGAFLLNFAKFVEWPAQAFKGPGDSITICVLGTSPFTPALDQAARQVVVENRTVTVRQIPDAQQAAQCQIVFVSTPERRRIHALLEAVQGGSVLTVGESNGFIASGGVIEFRVEDSRVRMEISAAAAKRAGLHISAKLLSLAESGKK